VFWRGMVDDHVTLGSKEPLTATRWGTSIQLTKSVTDRTGCLVRSKLDGSMFYSAYEYAETHGTIIE
jgi:hypothetical protein